MDVGHEAEVEDLAHRIISDGRVEGVTFVGGEPFAQAEGLAELGRAMQESGLSVVTFSGYVFEKLQRSARKGWRDLLAVTDLLIDGPFRIDLADMSRPWVGSANQRYHFLTDRYRYLEKELLNIPNRIEVRLTQEGSVLVNGLAATEDLDSLFEGIASRRL
jgi:anaerobic ribonucleoside-triphosphate reductase activating protein